MNQYNEVCVADILIKKYKDGSITKDEWIRAVDIKWFRLHTIYYIKDKDGNKILFSANSAQRKYYLSKHQNDIILKARQLGFTTFRMLHDLDDCLFKKNYSAGCIAHSDKDSKDIYRNKIRFAYRNIPPSLIKMFEIYKGYKFPLPVSDKDNSYVFSNGSSIGVSTGYRGGTLQSLHVSEFGKICKKYPDKAQEIVTGAFNSVGKNGTKTIESTAEGKEGYFYKYCDEAEKLKISGKEPASLEFKFHFFSWWEDPEYFVTENVDIPERLERYFDKVEQEIGRTLTLEQRKWYTLIERSQGEKMKQEYPSTPKEAFEKAIEGAYYATQFKFLYSNHRIGQLPNNDHLPVMTIWDLGVADSTAIWFVRKLSDTSYQVIDYYENSGEGMRHYFKVLKDKGYRYERHYAPHDIQNRSLMNDGKSRLDIAKEGYDIEGSRYSVSFEVVPNISIMDGIEQVREILQLCEFDEKKCADGITHLENYRKEWNDKLGCYRDNPLHDSHSHGADAFRMFAVAMSKHKPLGMLDLDIFGRKKR